LDYVAERIAGQRLNQDVDVVGHHTPFEQPITLAVEVQQGVFYQFSNTRVAEPAGAVSGVCIALDPFA
jgi:hypothetical protein